MSNEQTIADVVKSEIPHPPEGTDLPRSLYSCAFDGCAEEISNPADRMYWSESQEGWVCVECLEELDASEVVGIRLDVWMRSNTPSHH